MKEQIPLFIEITVDMALAIIEVDDAALSEGIGPIVDNFVDGRTAAWKDLLSTAELVAGKEAESTKATPRPEPKPAAKPIPKLTPTWLTEL